MTPDMSAMNETLEQELRRLIGEYEDDDAGDATKAEAWNMIADFAVENSKAILSALAAAAQEEEAATGEIRQAAEALLNNLWGRVVSGVRSHEDNWRDCERRFPGAKRLHDALRISLKASQEAEVVAWLTEGLGWRRVCLEREAADRLAASGHGEVRALVVTTPQPAPDAEGRKP